MIDAELLNQLEVALRDYPEVRVLSRSASSRAVRKLAGRLVSDTNQRWWWTGLGGKSLSYCYADSDGTALIRALLPGEVAMLLAVTDDQAPPWPVLDGSLDDFCHIISDVRFFEFFLFDESCSWAVFDTHDNVLVVVGSLVETAETIFNAQ